MNVHFAFFHAGAKRIVLGIQLAFVLVFDTVGTLFAAETTGAMSGSITEANTGAPLPAVAVTAVAPTVTFRKPDTSSAVGVSAPTLTGPFTVPAVTAASVDAGTHGITDRCKP